LSKIDGKYILQALNWEVDRLFLMTSEDIYFQKIYTCLSTETVISYNYTMARRDLPDIYALAPKVQAYISSKSRVAMV